MAADAISAQPKIEKGMEFGLNYDNTYIVVETTIKFSDLVDFWCTPLVVERYIAIQSNIHTNGYATKDFTGGN